MADALREADAANEVWTPELSQCFLDIDAMVGRPFHSGLRDLERRMGRLVGTVRETRDAEAIESLLAFGMERIDIIVAEHAPALSEAHTSALEQTYPASLLRNHNLDPETLVEIARRSLLFLYQETADEFWDPTVMEIDGIRAALSLPMPLKEAAWADVDMRRVPVDLESLATPRPDPHTIAMVCQGHEWDRKIALIRPDLSPGMEDRLLGGDDEMGRHLDWNWTKRYRPSARAMRRALELWPDNSGIAHRVAAFPNAPLDLLRGVCARWGEAVGRPLLESLAGRNDALADPEIRAALLDNPEAHRHLIAEARDEEFPALFRSVAASNPLLAADALDMRLGGGAPHGLSSEDLAPLFAMGGDAAERAMASLSEVSGHPRVTPGADQNAVRTGRTR